MTVTLGTFRGSGSSGWSTVTVTNNTYYCSDSIGDDSFNGQFPDNTTGGLNGPKKTLSEGKALLTNGNSDALLLKRGDTWLNQQFDLVSNLKGRSATEPMVFGAYGTGARPVIMPAKGSNCGLGTTFASNAGDFWAIMGIDWYCHFRDPSAGGFDATYVTSSDQCLSFQAPITWMLIEGCRFRFACDNIDLNNNGVKVTGGQVIIRRNVSIDAYSTGAFSKGLYAEDIDTLIVEENVFDSNGDNPTYHNPSPAFSRNVYDQYTVDHLIFRDNISSRSVSEGLQGRHNGRIHNNLFLHNPIGFAIGADSTSVTGATATTDMVADYNVVLECCDYYDGTARSTGLVLVNLSGSGVQINNNIIAHAYGPLTTNQSAMTLSRGGGSSSEGVNNTIIINNIIYDFFDGIAIINSSTGNTTTPNAVDLTGANTANYSAPTRTAGAYATSIGVGSTTNDFLTAARAQGYDASGWSDNLTANAFNNYIRSGFDQASLGIQTISPLLAIRLRLHA